MIRLLQAKGIAAIACRVSGDGLSLRVGILLIKADTNMPAHVTLRDRDSPDENHLVFIHPFLKSGVHINHDLPIREPCPF